MKTIKYLIAAAVVSTALFAGCKKGDTTNTSTGAYDKLMGPAANITVRVQNIPQRPGYMLQWTSGSMITGNVLFTGSYTGGNAEHQEVYQSNAMAKIDLVTSSVTNLGSVTVPYNKYIRGIFTVGLAPINSVTSLELSGQYYQIQPPSATAPFQPVPVIIAISTTVAVNSVMLYNLPIDRGLYTATISMDINKLTNGIDDAALSAAAKTNGAILITNESNPALYDIVVKNLENYRMNLQLSAVEMSTPANPAQ